MYQKADALLCVAELEILADGLHLILTDPYNEPKLKVRYPHSATYEEVRHALKDVCVVCGHAVCACPFFIAYVQTWLRLIHQAVLRHSIIHAHSTYVANKLKLVSCLSKSPSCLC